MNKRENITSSSYRNRTPDDYLNQIDPDILSSFNSKQVAVIKTLLKTAIPKQSPKIVDLRLTIDLIFSRFYLVIFVGKERRRGQREYPVRKITRFGNIVAATLLLIGINLMISLFIFLVLYLIKSALKIDLFPGGSLIDWLNSLNFF